MSKLPIYCICLFYFLVGWGGEVWFEGDSTWLINYKKRIRYYQFFPQAQLSIFFTIIKLIYTLVYISIFEQFFLSVAWNMNLSQTVSNNIIGIYVILREFIHITGVDPGFQVRRGALNKIAPSRGRHQNVWGISCEKSRFYPKKSYCFQLQREVRKLLGYFVCKITILRKKIILFPILGGAHAGGDPPPGSAPGYAQNRKIGKPNNLKLCEQENQKA